MHYHSRLRFPTVREKPSNCFHKDKSPRAAINKMEASRIGSFYEQNWKDFFHFFRQYQKYFLTCEPKP